MTKPLDGIKVLDFSEHGYVPSAAAALADFGADADAVKIELGFGGRRPPRAGLGSGLRVGR